MDILLNIVESDPRPFVIVITLPMLGRFLFYLVKLEFVSDILVCTFISLEFQLIFCFDCCIPHYVMNSTKPSIILGYNFPTELFKQRNNNRYLVKLLLLIILLRTVISLVRNKLFKFHYFQLSLT